ncbi:MULTISPECIES: hypothetical protein [unclassified Imperialibacter]|uniref:hypothetical protein n=1 Tax=unclassified Imperialibacter TaxID=2629706 RepID=UPI001256E8C7|nr:MULTISPECIES: hypothetical protein [unclassified Imperialibacter]CAD5269277.1 hypothetical protein IMPERIA89_340282 [Imperialibacter sp. 89]CAD5297492.1 hypothetical protein IMPERIA75_700282 [Imperialibacter sp. 75]VVT34121.1 hypothetical protein IMPR6_690282 [Imperialibacter sp. EC-SDR9]
MKLIAHNIERLLVLFKSGLFEEGPDFTFSVVDVALEKITKQMAFQIEGYSRRGFLKTIDSETIRCKDVERLFRMHGRGYQVDEVMALVYCINTQSMLLTDDNAMLKLCNNEAVLTTSYDKILEYVLDLRLKNDKLNEIKKSGRRPT